MKRQGTETDNSHDIKWCSNREDIEWAGIHNTRKGHRERLKQMPEIFVFFITVDTVLASLAHPGEDLGAKGIPSGFQRPLLGDL